eukprot:CAMPEP_0198142624 /NCGR_PEP_ID=MMETSP1443-20131203/5373_1 /TAXON_ID=186043 /ORGANISM="Entomoneis sp., Strain CCMP2396" /LENGTH=254 /DNA_ID=CAMNT_0043805679 /DNA_START=125 /DNA_END=889 /DNA_ORIENTATION=+
MTTHQIHNEKPMDFDNSYPSALPDGNNNNNNNTVFIVKPRRALTAYNLFFKDERVKMVKQQKMTGGKLSFAGMARAVSTKWKNISEDQTTLYEGLAKQEKARHARELSVWKNMKKAAAGEPEKKKQAPSLPQSPLPVSSNTSRWNSVVSTADKSIESALETFAPLSCHYASGGDDFFRSQQLQLVKLLKSMEPDPLLEEHQKQTIRPMRPTSAGILVAAPLGANSSSHDSAALANQMGGECTDMFLSMFQQDFS